MRNALGSSLVTFSALEEAGARTVQNPNTLYSLFPPSYAQGPSAFVRDVDYHGENFKVVYGQVPRPNGVGDPVAAVQSVSRAPAGPRHDALAADEYFNDLSHTFTQANKTAIVNTGLLALDAATLSRASAIRPPVADPPILPQFVSGGKTTGVLRIGVTETTIVSGRQGAAASLPKPSPGFNAITKTHVEGHAAAIMRQRGTENATLYINNPTVCRPCLQNFEHMLPANSRINVVLPDGTVKSFIGNSR